MPDFVGGTRLKSFMYIAHCSFVDRFLQKVFTYMHHIEISAAVFLQNEKSYKKVIILSYLKTRKILAESIQAYKK